MGHVLDASALAKRFLRHEDGGAFRSWYLDRAREPDALLGPRLLRYELGNIIAREMPRLPPPQRSRVLAASLDPVEEREPAATAVFDLAEELTFYDATYVALAREEDAGLVTADDAMAAHAEDLGVDVQRF